MFKPVGCSSLLAAQACWLLAASLHVLVLGAWWPYVPVVEACWLSLKHLGGASIKSLLAAVMKPGGCLPCSCLDASLILACCSCKFLAAMSLLAACTCQ